jgi:hypothetical protein
MARKGGILSIVIKKAKQDDTIKLRSSIVNNQFPDKSGLTFRYNQLISRLLTPNWKNFSGGPDI